MPRQFTCTNVDTLASANSTMSNFVVDCHHIIITKPRCHHTMLPKWKKAVKSRHTTFNAMYNVWTNAAEYESGIKNHVIATTQHYQAWMKTTGKWNHVHSTTLTLMHQIGLSPELSWSLTDHRDVTTQWRRWQELKVDGTPVRNHIFPIQLTYAHKLQRPWLIIIEKYTRLHLRPSTCQRGVMSYLNG